MCWLLVCCVVQDSRAAGSRRRCCCRSHDRSANRARVVGPSVVFQVGPSLQASRKTGGHAGLSTSLALFPLYVIDVDTDSTWTPGCAATMHVLSKVCMQPTVPLIICITDCCWAAPLCFPVKHSIHRRSQVFPADALPRTP
jgi:hypothetical protein